MSDLLRHFELLGSHREMEPFMDVTCDSCQLSGLVGYRYKCLRCADFDLCAACHEGGLLVMGHNPRHPFQCLMDRATRELHFAGEPIPELCADSFTCPVCGEMGHSEEELLAHIRARHRDSRKTVICPLCVAVPMSHPARVNNIVSHLNNFHQGNFHPFFDDGPPRGHARHTLPSAELPQGFIMPTGLRMGSPLAFAEDLTDTEATDM